MKRLLLVTIIGLVGAMTACQGKTGERCDKFFQNTCVAPATCIKTEEGSVCADSCSMVSKECPAGYECHGTTVGHTGIASGGYCLSTTFPE